ncbi:MAG: transposase [Candidatus Cloacimonetes bacterium]|jgi:hypothetical protein|nr:transposase [Candidatus Cloacimonadota bacterium]MDY0173281.1 transposase [Candidatus Cloacimonadaceae bacterium]
MKYLRIAQISQVKSSSLVESNALSLFNRFHLRRILKACAIDKEKGHPIEHMLYMMLVIMLQGSKSVYSGISRLQASKLKAPLNRMLNNEQYHWRNLLYRIAKVFVTLCPTPPGKVSALIIDDTAKEKTGRKVENSSWFYDHCRKGHYMGYQAIVAALHNGVATVPIDFELKIGKSRIKHAKKGHYHKGTHTEQRERMAKQKKTRIAESFIKRALQRGFKFQYLLWDSWYNNSDSLRFIYERLLPKGINLIAMVKRNKQKYLYNGRYLIVKDLYNRAGKWCKHKPSGIKYKSIIVEILDKKSAVKPESQSVLGKVKICFFKYPDHKNFQAVISTNLELSELEILEIYLRRWSIEVVFRDIKQYFGYDQSMSSKYAPQIADLTIRCVFYNMFCALKHDYPEKTTEQLVIEFYCEMEETWLDILCGSIFHDKTRAFLKHAVSQGYKDISRLLNDYESIFNDFMERQWYDDKIEEIDISNISQYGYLRSKKQVA